MSNLNTSNTIIDMMGVVNTNTNNEITLSSQISSLQTNKANTANPTFTGTVNLPANNIFNIVDSINGGNFTLKHNNSNYNIKIENNYGQYKMTLNNGISFLVSNTSIYYNDINIYSLIKNSVQTTGSTITGQVFAPTPTANTQLVNKNYVDLGDQSVLNTYSTTLKYTSQTLSNTQKSQSRSNIGLGSASVYNTGTTANTIPLQDSNGKLNTSCDIVLTKSSSSNSNITINQTNSGNSYKPVLELKKNSISVWRLSANTSSAILDMPTSYNWSLYYNGVQKISFNSEGQVSATSFVGDGSALTGLNTGSIISYQVITSTSTWVKPINLSSNSRVKIQMWGAGGGGPVILDGGGGGGSYCELDVLASILSSSVSVIIGAGGAPGSQGGNTTFGSYATAYGGGGGVSGTIAGGVYSSGGGAGVFGTGVTGTMNSAPVNGSGWEPLWGGGPGHYTGNIINAIYGGAGGGSSSVSGGISLYGGAGGNSGVNGSAPGGGGGRYASGARGEVRITVYK